jgi:hypothetical protein
MIYFVCPTEIADFDIKLEYISQEKGSNAPFINGGRVDLDLFKSF